MKIETLKKDNRKYWIVGSIVTLMLVSTIFFVATRANYKVTEKVNIANGIINYSPSDLNLMAVKVQNSSGGYDNASSVPTSGYKLSSDSYCEVNGVKDTSIPMEYKDGIVKIGINTKNTKCYLYFNKQLTAVSTLIAKGEMIEENGYRYEGANPNNYVTFNNEEWRIIGVFDVENSDTKQTESLVKIIRNDSIVNIAWDDDETNNWTNSTLKTILNEGNYFNKANDFSSVGLTSDAKAMIQSVKWKLGGASTSELTAEQFYVKERGTEVYSGRPTEWSGYVGLMYASDYGYAVDSESCSRTTTLYNYGISECSANNWLFNGEYSWTLTPNSSNSSDVFNVITIGYLYSDYAENTNAFRPSVYLKSSINITGGDGSESNPYTIA